MISILSTIVLNLVLMSVVADAYFTLVVAGVKFKVVTA